MSPVPLKAWAFGACLESRSVFILDLHLDIFILLHCKLLAWENIKQSLFTHQGWDNRLGRKMKGKNIQNLTKKQS